MRTFEDPDRPGGVGWEGARLRNGLVVLSPDYVLPGGRERMGGELTSCPVAGLQSPAVEEAFRAYRASEHGHLALVEPDPSAALLDAVDVVGGAVDAVTAWKMRPKK